MSPNPPMRTQRTDRSPWRGSALVSVAVASASAFGDDHQRAGDVLRYAMPAGVVAVEGWRGDGDGLRQFGAAWVVTVGATEALKRITKVERPDRSDDRSFPSGHAANAFAAATYMHRRHGFGEAWPWYAAATYVGWTRVHAGRHRWVDIAGSAALAAVSSGWLVTPAPERQVELVPAVARGRIALELHARW